MARICLTNMVQILVSTLILVGLLLPLPAQAEILFPFTGEVDFHQKMMVMVIRPDSPSAITIKIAQTPAKDKEYQMSTTINHWSLPFFDISTVLEGSVEIVNEQNGGQVLTGKVWSKYTLVNFKPMGELKGNWHIKDNTLFIDSLSIGTFNLSGNIQLTTPLQMDLKIRFSAIDIMDFVAIFTDRLDFAGKGDVQGEIKILGYPGKIFLKGKLRAYDGFIESLDFNSMTFNAEGIYPIIKVADSNITQTDGLAFNVSGRLDLSDKEHFEQQIKAFNREPLVQGNAEGLEWTLKRIRSGEHSGTTELKYMFKKEDALKTDTRDSSDMLGVERKVEF